MHRFTFKPAHRVVILAFVITSIFIATVFAVFAQFHTASQTEDRLGHHYARLISHAVNNGDKAELNRILDSMTEDEFILRAAVFTVQGERLALRGNSRLIPELLIENPRRKVLQLPVTTNDQVIAHLQWIREPNN